MYPKTDEQIQKDLASLPKSTGTYKKQIGNLKCQCGRIIGDETYYIQIQKEEMPEIFCEMCVSLN